MASRRPRTLGGPDWKTLDFTNCNFLGLVNLRIAGMPVPAVKKA